jgi:hypothetical protein
MPKNADEVRSKQNWMRGGSADEMMETYQNNLPEKVRKNAVHAVELIMTTSPEFTGNQEKYLQTCEQWACGLFGEENIIHVAQHKDELTPHVHILAMPLKDGKLNAKHFIGGSRDRMTELQDDFFQKVGVQFGLERGQSRAKTRARHTPHTLATTAARLEEEEKKIKAILKVPPAEALIAIGVYRELRTKTPDDLKNLSNKILEKKCDTWGEYRDKMEREYEREKKNQQQQKPRGRSR